MERISICQTLSDREKCQKSQVRSDSMVKVARFIFILSFKEQRKSLTLLCLDTDFDDDGLETFKRYKPRSLDELASRTKFSKKEIQLIYQGFKQECPSGMNEFLICSLFLFPVEK